MKGGTGLRGDLHGDQGASEVLWREGQRLASGRHGYGGDGAILGRGVSDRLLEQSDGILGNLIERMFREKSHHRTAVAIGVDDGGGLRARVGRTGKVGRDGGCG